MKDDQTAIEQIERAEILEKLDRLLRGQFIIGLMIAIIGLLGGLSKLLQIGL